MKVFLRRELDAKKDHFGDIVFVFTYMDKFACIYGHFADIGPKKIYRIYQSMVF
jgi:hypothetical protein